MSCPILVMPARQAGRPSPDLIGDEPAIHRKQGICLKKMDARVKPGHDGFRRNRLDLDIQGARMRPGTTEGGHTLPLSASPISSSTLGSSIVAGIVHVSPSAIFLMVPRRILPERVFGSRPTVIASLNAATGPSFSRTSATISFSISTGLRVTPA